MKKRGQKLNKTLEVINQNNVQLLQKIIDIKHKETVISIIELFDLRIATGDWNGNINVFSINYESKKWEPNILLKGHNKNISSLCELSDYRLISLSNKTIKLWKISKDSLTLWEELTQNIDTLYKRIPLSDNLIVSGAMYGTITVWNVNAYKTIRSLKDNFAACSLLKLTNKNEFVSGENGNSISFWNTNTFIKEHSVPCCACHSNSGLIELSNHYIAVNGGTSLSIDIIDTEHYQRIKQIECKDYIISMEGSVSSLSLLNSEILVYSHHECCCLISKTYEILHNTKIQGEFEGSAIINSLNGKYIAASNANTGISMFSLNFKKKNSS